MIRRHILFSFMGTSAFSSLVYLGCGSSDIAVVRDDADGAQMSREAASSPITDAGNFTVICNPTSTSLLAGFNAQKIPDYFALRTETMSLGNQQSFVEASPWSVTTSEAIGTACRTATNPTTCNAALASFRKLAPEYCESVYPLDSQTCSMSYLIATHGDDVVVVDVTNFTSLFGDVVSWQEAAALVASYAVPASDSCAFAVADAYQVVADGFDIQIHNSCGFYKADQYDVLHVAADATTTNVLTVPTPAPECPK